jgi:hypothetical protein
MMEHTFSNSIFLIVSQPDGETRFNLRDKCKKILQDYPVGQWLYTPYRSDKGDTEKLVGCVFDHVYRYPKKDDPDYKFSLSRGIHRSIPVISAVGLLIRSIDFPKTDYNTKYLGWFKRWIVVEHLKELQKIDDLGVVAFHQLLLLQSDKNN